jgi:D-glycero-D-manno-heptose 1,7-bisphosphate phosphatase
MVTTTPGSPILPKKPFLARSLVLLDRDGVVVVNRRTNIKRPSDLQLLPGAAAAIARLNAAGYEVAICTNQPEIGRGVMSRRELDKVHAALKSRLATEGAQVELVLCCTSLRKSPWLKPAPGMLKAALDRYGRVPGETPFVGDQLDDLKAAFHAGCPRILVRTGLGRHTLRAPLPDYVKPVRVVEDLAEAADSIIDAGSRERDTACCHHDGAVV